MGLLSKVADFIGGSMFDGVKDTVMAYFPPDMSEADKAKLELELELMFMEKQKQANKFLQESSVALDKRIAQQEGTAADFTSLPVIGRILLFARGAQRPVWGFATLWMDFRWFFGGYTFDEQQQTALIVINVLVLGFLFGERAIQNLTPMLVQVFAKK